jgi:hypothetical protein
MSALPPGKPVGVTPHTGQHSQPYDPTAAARRVQQATQYASRNATSAFGAQLSPVADPNQSLVGFKSGFQDAARICLGWIMDGTSIANCYRVHVEKGRAPIIASALTGTSPVCFGATEINTYAPGTPVIIMVHDKIATGYILGAVPGVLDVGTRAYHDYITQASRKRVDDVHKKYIKQPMSGQIVDWSAWRPYDATLGSEWGAISTTGLKVTLDDFLVQLAVNEFTGVFGFYHDALLRVAGYNLQTWTAGHERDAMMDQAEYNDFQGYSPYPWEAMGLLQPGIEMIADYAPNTYQCPSGKPFYAHWENKHEHQQPYHRTQQYFGYLGQGSRFTLQAPPADLERWTYKPGVPGDPGTVYDSSIQSVDGAAQNCDPGAPKLTEHQDSAPYGLHEDNVAQDGRRFIASAKGVTLLKRILLPMPSRLKRPEAGDGDDAKTNYKSASKYGAGPDHTITGDILTKDEFPNLQRASAVLDLHGYLFNYAGLHPFHWHIKDYKTWEQEELQYATCNQAVPAYAELKGSMYLKQPTATKLKIDHRYGEQDFYETEAYLSLLEDGSVVIGDGYGAEIKMSGGCLTLSAPGDVWVKSGRHTQTWAGGDVIQRANGNVDISTTEKSVRIKAEQNVMVLGGNDTTDGGVLIESRSKTQTYDFEKAGDDVKFGGVVLRAPNSNIVGLGHQIYMRTGGGGSEIRPGNITLDAGRGEAELITKSYQLFHYVGESGTICHFFRESADSNTKKANYFTRDYTLMAGPLGLDGALFAAGDMVCNGSVVAGGGGVVAASGAPYIGKLDDKTKNALNNQLDQIRRYADSVIPQAADYIDKTQLAGFWYDDKKPGNARVMDIMEFSFRVDEQYHVPDFLLYEDRWQQLARLAGKIPDTWTEKAVKSKTAGETYPFPGRAKLTQEPTYMTQDLDIATADGEKLRDKPRLSGTGDLSPAYKNPQFKEGQKKTINGTYPIIGRGQ